MAFTHDSGTSYSDSHRLSNINESQIEDYLPKIESYFDRLSIERFLEFVSNFFPKMDLAVIQMKAESSNCCVGQLRYVVKDQFSLSAYADFAFYRGVKTLEMSELEKLRLSENAQKCLVFSTGKIDEECFEQAEYQGDDRILVDMQLFDGKSLFEQLQNNGYRMDTKVVEIVELRW